MAISWLKAAEDRADVAEGADGLVSVTGRVRWSRYVLPGRPADLGDGDAMEGCVELSVAAAVEPVTQTLPDQTGTGRALWMANASLEWKRLMPAASPTILAAVR